MFCYNTYWDEMFKEMLSMSRAVFLGISDIKTTLCTGVILLLFLFPAEFVFSADGRTAPATSDSRTVSTTATGTSQISPAALESLGSKNNTASATSTAPMSSSSALDASDSKTDATGTVQTSPAVAPAGGAAPPEKTPAAAQSGGTTPTRNADVARPAEGDKTPLSDTVPSAEASASAAFPPTGETATPSVASPSQSSNGTTQAVKAVSLYIVRSGPILTEQDKNQRVQLLKLAGYHPVVKKETLKEGKVFYILELGRFTEMSMAVDLLLKLKDTSSDFFIVGTGNGVDLLAGSGLKEIFPGKGMEGEEDNLTLLSAHAANFKTAGISSNNENVEKLIVRKLIRPGDKGIAKPVQDTASSNPAKVVSPKVASLLPASNKIIMRKPNIESTEGASLSVRERLLKIAWQMREGGYDVRLEDEDKPGPEGKLVGIFNRKEDALDLAQELKEYGYAVNVIQEENGGGLFGVYADPESVSGDISVITPDTLKQYKQKKGFIPPEDTSADTLLNLMQSQQNR